MSWIWLAPAGLAVVAVAVSVWALRTLDAEAEHLRDAWRAVPALAQQGRTVRAEAARGRSGPPGDR